MTTRAADISLRQAALITAYSILVMLLFLLLTAAIQGLTVPGDAAATAKNIADNELLFRAGVCGYIVIVILDVLLAWALYVLLKPVNASLSLLMGWFRLGYAIIFAVAVGKFFNILQLISDYDYMTVFGADQLQAEVMLSLNGFELIWQIGYVFFGMHIIFLGYLIVKSGYIPRFLGVLLIFGGFFGDLLESFISFLFPDYSAIAWPGLIAAGIGEFALCVWILWKGKNTIETQSKSLNVASLGQAPSVANDYMLATEPESNQITRQAGSYDFTPGTYLEAHSVSRGTWRVVRFNNAKLVGRRIWACDRGSPTYPGSVAVRAWVADRLGMGKPKRVWEPLQYSPSSIANSLTHDTIFPII